MTYNRGDIFYISGGKTYAGFGRQVEAGRPAIIVSDDGLNEHSDYVEVVYLTTQQKRPLPTHCQIVCKQLSTALCETIYTINKDRIGDYVKTCTAEEMARVNECLLNSIGLDYMSDFSEPVPDERATVEFEKMKDELEMWKAKCNEQAHYIEGRNSVDSAVVIERDLYKKLYEQLLDKAV